MASGQAQVGFNGTGVTVPLIQSGKIRVLAVTSSQRSATLPDAPTMKEAGLKDYEFVSAITAVVPTGTPQATVDEIGSALKVAAAKPEFKEFCMAQGLNVAFKGPSELQKAAPGEFEKAARLVKLAGLNTGH